jgi:hypothetical protein
MALVTLTLAGSHPEALLLKGLLEAEGIPVAIKGESRGTDMGTEAGFAEIQLLVPEEALERARQLLDAKIVKDEPEKRGGIPEGAVCPVHELQALHVCSRCGSYLCERCGPIGVPPLCESCNDRLAQQPRKRTATKTIALLLLLFLLGVPTVAAVIMRLLLGE